MCALITFCQKHHLNKFKKGAKHRPLGYTRPQGYKTFFVLVLILVLRTRNLCSTEYDTKNRGYKSFGVRSPPSWIWSMNSNIITYGVSRDCFKRCTNLHNYQVKQTQYGLEIIHFIDRLNEGIKSQVACVGHTSCHAQRVCLHGGSSLTVGGSKMKC